MSCTCTFSTVCTNCFTGATVSSNDEGDFYLGIDFNEPTGFHFEHEDFYSDID